MGLRDQLLRRLRAAAEGFVDPASVEPDDAGLQPPDDGEDDPFSGLSQASPLQRPAPREGLNDLVVIVLDSCRWDALMEAAPPHIGRLGEVRKRWSYASWTGPSHYNLLTGLLPHASPTEVFASDVYKEEFARFSQRLGVDVEFEGLLPGLWLPTFLRWGLGYRTCARVSLPVLNEATGINRDFDDYRLMERHDDMAAMLPELRFGGGRPCFYLLNIGETHYPYSTPTTRDDELPYVSGVRGAVRQLEGGGVVRSEDAPAWFDDAMMQRLRSRQVDAVRHVDAVVGDLFDLTPPGTWFVVTSDHGELFGEDGYFGHGPIAHDKVFEVPFVEGRIR